ncbi:hypothetical protein EPO56_01590 [Patescibacteria group bacterium]|nr:MAG: hypothetical protein EPO56_01590 [Patescibacteria group bacterium]
MKNNFIHISIAIILVGLLTLLGDPFMVWMPMGGQMFVLLGATIFLCIWAGFVMFENSHDEREVLHMQSAGRFAYLSGIGVLLIALIYQGFTHAIDSWILGALAVMVVSKLIARLYLERSH